MNKKIFLSLFIYIGLWQFFSGGIAMAKQENLTFTGIERFIVDGSFFSVEVAGYSEKYIDAHIIIPDRVFKDGVKVKIKVGSTNAKGRVVTGNGKILIQGKSSSGGQIYR